MLKHHFYQLADLVVMTDCVLTYVCSVEPIAEPDVVISQMTEKPVRYDEVQALHNAGTFMVYQYLENGAYYSYAGQGYFEVSGGNRITYYLYDQYSHDFLMQTILCQCFGAILAERGMLGIHSSVCFLHGKSVIICGDSGAGKTTLTAELINRGAEFMADDTACITMEDEILVHALVPLRKVCEDTLQKYPCDEQKLISLYREAKIKVGIKEDDIFHSTPEAVGAMFWLHIVPVDKVTLQPINGVQKLETVKRNIYAPGAYRDILKTPDYFMKIFRFCQIVPMYEVVRPKDGDTLTEIADLIEAVLKA